MEEPDTLFPIIFEVSVRCPFLLMTESLCSSTDFKVLESSKYLITLVPFMNINDNLPPGHYSHFGWFVGWFVGW